MATITMLLEPLFRQPAKPACEVFRKDVVLRLRRMDLELTVVARSDVWRIFRLSPMALAGRSLLPALLAKTSAHFRHLTTCPMA